MYKRKWLRDTFGVTRNRKVLMRNDSYVEFVAGRRTEKMKIFTIITICAAIYSKCVLSFSNNLILNPRSSYISVLHSSAKDTVVANSDEEETIDYDVPEDAVINIKPKAMKRLRELREKQNSDSLILRMGVRNGGKVIYFNILLVIVRSFILCVFTTCFIR